MIEEQKEEFLLEFLKNAPFDGWSEACIYSSSLKLKDDKYYGYILFPSGEEEIAQYFAIYIDGKMSQSLKTKNLEGKKIREKIFYLVKLRIEFYQPYKEAVRAFIKANLNPLKIPTSTKILWNTADNFWNSIGDNSTDYNFYTKRLLLSCVYSKTLLYWLDDISENNDKTFLFLEGQIASVLKIGKVKKIISNSVEKITKAPFIRLLFIK